MKLCRSGVFQRALITGTVVGLQLVCRTEARPSGTLAAQPGEGTFGYDTSAKFDLKEQGSETRNGVVIRDVDYESYQNRHGRMKAYVVGPTGSGPFAGVLFFHWLGEKKSNREEFLEEAVTLARSGVVSLLIQGFFPWSEPPVDGEKDRQQIADQTIEVRRGLDLLQAQPGVDRHRIGFVGHDYGAMFGAIVAGLEHRARTYVFIAGLGNFGDWSLKYWPKTAAKGENAYRDEVSVADPVKYVNRASPASLLFQFSKNDKYISGAEANAFFSAASDPKAIKWYDADHSLDTEAASRDRSSWLAEQLPLALSTATASPNDSGAIDLSKPNQNHHLLSELAGTWNYTLKVSMGTNRPAVETTGTVVRQPIMGGRFFLADFQVEMLPGSGGKLQKVGFAGKSIEGYDNVRQKFVSMWIDNQSTGITTFEGTYDPGSHSFTYTAETEPQPGKTTKVRELITVVDANHYRLDWFEHHAGREVKTVEISYTRARGG